jgi:hypothetical protein
MPLSLVNLNVDTRAFMMEEIVSDDVDGALYISEHLSPAGKMVWPNLLRIAAQHYDDSWLAHQLSLDDRINSVEPRRNSKTGAITMAAVPHNAHETVAEGEFNRYYARGVCLLAVAKGIRILEVYRAKSVDKPRAESLSLIGTHIAPEILLADLRDHKEVDTALGVPPGPNSGISVRLP